MTPEDIMELFVSGIILVIGIFVFAVILAPDLANILDTVVVQAISLLTYIMVFAVFLAIFYQMIREV